MSLYMHTLDHKPAYYQPGEQVVFAGWHVRSLCPSLKVLRAEQAKSAAWRIRRHYHADIGVMGYARVTIVTAARRPARKGR